MDYTVEQLKSWDLDHLWHPYTQMATYDQHFLMITGAEGCMVYDSAGNAYIDGISGLWNVNVGHGRQEIIESITRQLNELDFYPLNGFSYQSAILLAKKLAELAPPGLEKVFFCNGGSEANETAIKMARAYWKLRGQANKYKIISLNNAWHGATFGSLSASHIASEKVYFEPLPAGFVHMPQPNCYRCPFGKGVESCDVACASYLREVIAYEGAETIAAFIAEPIQGLGGVIVPPERYWPLLRRICDEHEILLIIDEVAAGFGRAGSAFAISQWDVSPDLMVCSKGITSGYLPLSAVLATAEVFRPFLADQKYFQHGYTTGGHPASCAAALANLEIMEREQLLAPAPERAGALLEAFRSLSDLPLVGDVRGRGHMVGVELVLDRQTKAPFPRGREVCALLRERGILVRPIGNIIPFFPPLTISQELIEQAVRAYREAIVEAARLA